MHCFGELAQYIRNGCPNLLLIRVLKTIGKIILSDIKGIQCLGEVPRPWEVAFEGWRCSWCQKFTNRLSLSDQKLHLQAPPVNEYEQNHIVFIFGLNLLVT